MREASYVQLQYLFEMVHMAKPCFGTSTRLPSIVMLEYLSVKNFIQGRVRGKDESELSPPQSFQRQHRISSEIL